MQLSRGHLHRLDDLDGLARGQRVEVREISHEHTRTHTHAGVLMSNMRKTMAEEAAR